MTSKEALGILYSKADTTKECWECRQIVQKDLDLLDLYKKFFKYSLTEIQGIKYLVLPNNSDIRRPDTMLRITDDEYELLKEGLEK